MENVISRNDLDQLRSKMRMIDTLACEVRSLLLDLEEKMIDEEERRNPLKDDINAWWKE